VVFLQFKKFLTIERVPRIADCCICVYVFGCKLSLVKLCDSDFGITPVNDITIGITCAVFCFHIAHTSFVSSWYLFCLSIIVLARLCVFGTATSIKKGVLCFLIHKSYVRSIKRYCFVRSVLRFQYSFKFSFSSTLAGVYLYYGHLSSVSSAASVSFWWIILVSPSCLFTNSVGASCSHAAVMCWIVSDSFPHLLHS